MHETIEARLIPALKRLADEAGKASEKLKSIEDAKERARLVALAKPILSGVVADKFLKTAVVSVSWSRISFAAKDIHITVHLTGGDEGAEPRESRRLCARKATLYKWSTHVGALRKIASYMRTVHGSTKAVLALSDSAFCALLSRYVDDALADRSCKI